MAGEGAPRSSASASAKGVIDLHLVITVKQDDKGKAERKPCHGAWGLARPRKRPGPSVGVPQCWPGKGRRSPVEAHHRLA
jgi:hypothetical protein